MEKLLQNAEGIGELLEKAATQEGDDFEDMSEEAFAQTETGRLVTQIQDVARAEPAKYGASLAAVDNFMLARGPESARASIHADRTGLVSK